MRLSPPRSDALNFAMEALALQKASVESRRRDLSDSRSELSRIAGLRQATNDLYPRETTFPTPSPLPSDIDALYDQFTSQDDASSSGMQSSVSSYRRSRSLPERRSLSYAYILEFMDSLLMEREHIILTPSSSQTVLSPATKLLLNPETIETLPIAKSPLLCRISNLDTNAILELRDGVEQQLLQTVSDEDRRVLTPSMRPVPFQPRLTNAIAMEGATEVVSPMQNDVSLIYDCPPPPPRNTGNREPTQDESKTWPSPLDFSLEDTEPSQEINASMRRMVELEKNLQEMCSHFTFTFRGQ